MGAALVRSAWPSSGRRVPSSVLSYRASCQLPVAAVVSRRPIRRLLEDRGDP